MAKRGLGKGLDALFQAYTDTEVDETVDSQVQELRIHQVDPNEEQPRKNFNRESIDELSKSILEHGVVQPIIVKPKGDRYIIVTGERRWRAARAAGLDSIPVIIRDMDEREMLEIALVENLQREDLNPMEEAEGISNLIKGYGLTQEQVAQRLGKSRPAISNSLRLLSLPEEIKDLLVENKITPGHARALLALKDDKEKIMLANAILEKGLNVREVEALVKGIEKAKVSKKTNRTQNKSPFIVDLENQMEEIFGTKVVIQQGKQKGVIAIEYYNNDDLGRIMDLILED